MHSVRLVQCAYFLVNKQPLNTATYCVYTHFTYFCSVIQSTVIFGTLDSMNISTDMNVEGEIPEPLGVLRENLSMVLIFK
jgi:hypothetical protein